MLTLALTLLCVGSTATSSTTPHVELITIGPGGELSSYWGHTAVRVVDARAKTDWAYNFGGVKIDEDFALEMLRGRIEAFVYRVPFAELLKQYSGEDRTIVRRPLRLSEAASERLSALLETTLEGPRARYRYDHFRDNCSTRVFDELDRALDGALRREGGGHATGTFRSRVLSHVRNTTWLYVGLDLLSSSVVDRPITRWETAFLCPDLATFLDGLVLDGEHLVSGEYEIFRSISQEADVLWTWPWLKVYLFFVAPLVVLGLFFARPVALAFGMTAGLAGTFLAVVSLVTSFDFCQHNWNVLVLPPTHLALAAVALRARAFEAARSKLLIYLGAHGLLLLGLILAHHFGAIEQAIGPALGFSLPLTLVLARSCLPQGRSEA